MRSIFARVVAAAFTLAAASSASAATQVSVGPSKQCGEDGCFGGDKKTFTQVISAADHKGTVNISSLSLFRSVIGSMAGQNVKVIFELADGTEVTWGRWTVGTMAGDQFVTIGGETVNWDSALGDLKVRLELFKPEKSHGNAWGWGAGGSDNTFGESGLGLAAPELPFGDVVNTGPLLRPSLPPQPIVAVPEPGTWALMITGFGLAGAALRRRRAVPHLQPQL